MITNGDGVHGGREGRGAGRRLARPRAGSRYQRRLGLLSPPVSICLTGRAGRSGPAVTELPVLRLGPVWVPGSGSARGSCSGSVLIRTPKPTPLTTQHSRSGHLTLAARWSRQTLYWGSPPGVRRPYAPV